MIDATIALIDDPTIDVDGLIQYIPGPDFPTAGIINGTAGIVDGYRTGRGRVRMRARAEVEVADNGREAIVVTEIPYQVNKARLIEKIAELVKEKKLEGISELRDESDKDGMRIYIEVKRGESAEVVLNNLYQQTQMESVFGINMVAHRRRPAEAAEPEGPAGSLRQAPPRSRHPPHHLRTAQGAPARTHPRRPDRRAGQHRRDDRADQDVGQPERSARAHARPHVGAGPGRRAAGRVRQPMPRVRKTCRPAWA